MKVKFTGSWHLIDDLVDSLEDRATYLKEYVLSSLAERFKKALVASAPKQLVERYSQNLRVVRVGKTGNFSLIYFDPSQAASNLNPATTLYYIRPKYFDRISPESPQAKMMELFDSYQPFTFDFLPSKFPKSGFYVSSKEVTEKEVQLIAKKNASDRPDFQKAISAMHLNIGLKPISSKQADKLVVFGDIAFEALRREFGNKDRPHLRPTVKMHKKGFFVKKIIKDDDIKKFLDPEYSNFENLVTINESIPKSKISDFDDFQSIILGLKRGD